MFNIFVTTGFTKYALSHNTKYKPLKRSQYKHITNTSCIVVWLSSVDFKYRYMIQKRSGVMNSGANKLAIAGGMLETTDTTLQQGAVREMLEESGIVFSNHNNMTPETVKTVAKHLFLLSEDSTNMTFFFILLNDKMPSWRGPIGKNKGIFKKSSREIDTTDTSWGDVKKGHCFMTSHMIKQHFNNNIEPAFWNYSKKSLLELFKILEPND